MRKKNKEKENERMAENKNTEEINKSYNSLQYWIMETDLLEEEIKK